MAYEKTQWIDHVVDGEGKVVQQGTPVNAENLNKMEDGIANSLEKNSPIKMSVLGSGTGKGLYIYPSNSGSIIETRKDVNDANSNRVGLRINNAATPEASIASLAYLERHIAGEASQSFKVIHEGNLQLITPDAIGAASTDHIHKSDDLGFYDLKNAEALKENADLDVLFFGNYACHLDEIAATLKNCPVTERFDLRASNVVTWFTIQELRTFTGKIYIRSTNLNGSGALYWTDWFQIYTEINKPTTSDIGAAPETHKHNASDIDAGTLNSSRLPTVPVSKGGTGATNKLDAFKNLSNNGAIIPLDNEVVKYFSDTDNDESLFNAWLDALMERMPTLSSVPIVFRCNPAISGSAYYGILNKHTADFATLTATTYTNENTGYLHKVKSTTWKNAKFLYQEITPADIGAAPDGFGLGEYSKFLDSATNLDDVTSNGWYSWATSQPIGAPDHYCTMFVATMNHNQITQIVYVQEENNVTLQRTRISGVWYPWECTSKKYGTADLTAGVSPLRNGELYFVYE